MSSDLHVQYAEFFHNASSILLLKSVLHVHVYWNFFNPVMPKKCYKKGLRNGRPARPVTITISLLEPRPWQVNCKITRLVLSSPGKGLRNGRPVRPVIITISLLEPCPWQVNCKITRRLVLSTPGKGLRNGRPVRPVIITISLLEPCPWQVNCKITRRLVLSSPGKGLRGRQPSTLKCWSVLYMSFMANKIIHQLAAYDTKQKVRKITERVTYLNITISSCNNVSCIRFVTQNTCSVSEC